MTSAQKRRPATNGTALTTTTADETDEDLSVILTRPGDGVRSRRIRWARRQLDEMLGQVDPWVFSEPVGDPYHDNHLDRGMRERDYLGRDLAGRWP